VVTRRVSKNLQQAGAGGGGTAYRGDNTCQKKSRDTVQPQSRVFFVNHFWGRRPDGVAINEALKIVNNLEFKWSTDRDEGFLEVKDAEANEQHKSIISALKAAAPGGNLTQLILLWVTANLWLRATSTPSSKSLIYKNGKKTSSSLIM